MLLGNSLDGKWKPFLADSPWNTPIAEGAETHPDSDLILAHMRTKSSKLMMSRNYTIPVYVVDYRDMEMVKMKSPIIFDYWDQNQNGISDVGVPWTSEMWPEQTNDGHISIIDPQVGIAWELSRFKPELRECTTFNMWNLKLGGYGNPEEGKRWWARGGRASGFPEIAGLARREQVFDEGVIPHALVFTFPEVRKADGGEKIFMHPPACRSDGEFIGRKYPIMGELFQLVADETDFVRWGLSNAAKVIARTLRKFGMRLGDRGGAWKIQPQLLAKTIDEQIASWHGLYSEIERIPTSAFRMVYTGEPTIKRG